jgi:uncharacterized protein
MVSKQRRVESYNLMSNYPRVSIPNTEVHIFKSSNVDQEFEISVCLPHDYTASNKSYPTVYLLDANFYFATVTDFFPLLTFFSEIPEMIIVGIGYPTIDFFDVVEARYRDFLPTHDAAEDHAAQERAKSGGYRPMKVSSGGGENFLTFIREELIPFIDTEYRTNPADKTIAGHSHGGLFVIYTLFQQPTIFTRYIATSPSLAWHNRVAFTIEQDFYQSNSTLEAKLFLSAGGLEEDLRDKMVSNLYQFHSLLKSRNYAGLEMEMVIFDNETHISVVPVSLSRGLKYVFRKTDNS